MNEVNLYQPVWKKYFPVIAIKLKKAIRNNAAEELLMDRLDFEKAANKKNSAYQFSFELNEGLLLNSTKVSAPGRDFAKALNDHDVLKELVKIGSFKFSMGSKFILTIEKTEINFN